MCSSPSRTSSYSDASLQLAQEEVDVLKQRLRLLETQLEVTRANQGALQVLLQQAYQHEWEHLDSRKRSAEEEMVEAQRVVCRPLLSQK